MMRKKYPTDLPHPSRWLFCLALLVLWSLSDCFPPSPSVAGLACKRNEDCGDTARCSSGTCKQLSALDASESLLDIEPDKEQPCQPGTTRTCYTGPAGTQGVGPCKAGTQICDGTQRWSDCRAQQLPQTERCGDQIDDDCDGKIDDIDTCLCNQAAQTQPCYTSDTGCIQQSDKTYQCNPPCKPGQRTCLQTKGGLRWGICEGETRAITEDCNGKDDDCNGKIDDNPLSTRPCANGSKGVCAGSLQTCQNGQWTECSEEDYLKYNASYQNTDSSCDGKDNDCDGKTDEEYTPNLSCLAPHRKGECQKSLTSVCANGKELCFAPNPPKYEICDNGLDDDCDGTIDEKNGCGFPFKELLTDYSVLDDGTLFVLHQTERGKPIRATCYKPDGTIKRQTFPLGKVDPALYYYAPTVRTARSGWFFVVGYIKHEYRPPTYLYYVELQRFDADCTPHTQPIALKATSDTLQTDYSHMFDIGIDKNGGLYAIFRQPGKDPQYNKAFLHFVPANSETPITPLPLHHQDNLPDPCELDLRIAVNPSGQGVAICTSQTNKSLFFRRFETATGKSNLLFTDNLLQEANTTKGKLTPARGNVLTGINQSGDAAFFWRQENPALYQVAFLKKNERTPKSPTLPILLPPNPLPNLFKHPSLTLHSLEGDFILNNTVTQTSTPKPTLWLRYSTDGKLKASAKSHLNSHSLRFIRKTDILTIPQLTYLHGKDFDPVTQKWLDTSIFRGAIDLSASKGVCKEGLCPCNPQTDIRTCYSAGPATPPPLTPCLEGISLCKPDGSGWEECKHQSTPVTEICNNGIDDDCDGDIDESCNQNNTFNVISKDVSLLNRDHDIAQNGRITLIYTQSYKQLKDSDTGDILWASCYHNDGKIIRDRFRIQDSGGFIKSPMVRMAENGELILISWLSRENDLPDTPFNLHFRLYDKDCKPKTSRLPITPIETLIPFYDTALSDKGHIAIAYRDKATPQPLKLNFYKSNGTNATPTQTARQPDPSANNQRCPLSKTIQPNAFRLAMNPDTGDGMISCQPNVHTQPLAYRLFKSDGTLGGSDMATHTPSNTNRNSIQQTHITAMNRKGEFVIAWVSLPEGKLYASFFSDGKPPTNVNVHTYLGARQNNFVGMHRNIELYGDDFVFFNGEQSLHPTRPKAWLRYDGKGQQLFSITVDPAAKQLPETLRISGNFVSILQQQKISAEDQINIQVNTLKFSTPPTPEPSPETVRQD